MLQSASENSESDVSDHENGNGTTYRDTKRQKLDASNSESESDNELMDDDDNASEDENEEVTENMELEQRKQMKSELKFKKNIKELLPIKTRTGVFQRTIQDDNDKVNLPSLSTTLDNVIDDDELKEVVPQVKKVKKTLLSVPELLIEREREFIEKKLKIGRICSSMIEKPEDKIGSLRTLIELVAEYGQDKEKNLLSVRKLAILSLSEVFKEIIPEYKIGVVDLESTKVKKDTLARVTYENELLRYYKKYLKETEALLKALTPGKYSKRPSKENIYIAETAIKCLCEMLLAHPNFNFSTNIAQLLVVYLNCSNSTTRKVINETFVKIFKTDKRLDLTRHVRFLINS